MQIFSSNKLAAQPRLIRTRQKGISLIPALITIFIFTLLTTQVIIPNQFRDTHESLINSLANSAEKLEQASLAYYAKNKSWPTSIKPDLVPNFLPVFNPVTDTGFSWKVIETYTTTSGFVIYDPRSRGWGSPPWGFGLSSAAILIEVGDHQLAEALVNKIGGHASLSRLDGPNIPAYGYSDESLDFVYIPFIGPGTTTVTDLRITQDITIERNIILTGEIRAPDGTTVFDASSSPTSSSANPDHYHSSKRFKQNIYPLDTPIESIYQLKPVSFDYKEPFTEYKTANAANQEIGLIAEQVLPLIPEITLVKDDRVMGIDYSKLSILLLKAVQDLKKDVEILQQNNQQLQKQINGLNRDSPKVATVVDLDEMSSAQ